MARSDRPPIARVTAVAPCRIDCGGTLDIAPLALGLARHKPATFNIALAVPTKVTARPNPDGGIKISSVGFEPETGDGDRDLTGPLGFFFLAANALGVTDVDLTIDSASPPRSALGGSSVALVAAVAALAPLARRRLTRLQTALLAQRVEQALFDSPCGRQDQLAAAYGGVRLWTWSTDRDHGFRATKLLKGGLYSRLEKRLLVAYPGQTHSSSDVNSRWVAGFLTGSTRPIWREIIAATRGLARAVAASDWDEAARWLNRETELRLELTPEVLTETGQKLCHAAQEAGCGARFTGAGGGGCLWALGPQAAIDRLRPVWNKIVSAQAEGRLLPTEIDRVGLRVTTKRGGN